MMLVSQLRCCCCCCCFLPLLSWPHPHTLTAVQFLLDRSNRGAATGGQQEKNRIEHIQLKSKCGFLLLGLAAAWTRGPITGCSRPTEAGHRRTHARTYKHTRTHKSHARKRSLKILDNDQRNSRPRPRRVSGVDSTQSTGNFGTHTRKITAATSTHRTRGEISRSRFLPCVCR